MKEKSKLNSLRSLTGGLRVLQILFKEVLQQISAEDADKLADAYRRGEQVLFVLKQSTRATFEGNNPATVMTAFSYAHGLDIRLSLWTQTRIEREKRDA